MASIHIRQLETDLTSAVLFYDEQSKRGEREIVRLRNELAVELQLQNQREIDAWRFSSDQDVVFRWESGNINYAQVIEHTPIAERIVDAYTRLRPNTIPPESHLIQLTAGEAYVGRCKTPSDTSSWPREFGALGERNPFWYEGTPVRERCTVTKQDLGTHKAHVPKQVGTPGRWKPPRTIASVPSRTPTALVHISTMDAWGDWSDDELCRRWEGGSLSKDIAENETLANRLRTAYFNRSGIQSSPPLVKYIQGTAEEVILNGYSTPKQTKTWQILFGKLKRPDSHSKTPQVPKTTVNASTKGHTNVNSSLLQNPRRNSLQHITESNDLILAASNDNSHNVQGEKNFAYTLVENFDTGSSGAQNMLRLEATRPRSDYRKVMKKQNESIKVATPKVAEPFNSPSNISSEISKLDARTREGRKRKHDSPVAMRRSAKKSSHRQQSADKETESEEVTPANRRERKALRAEMAPHNNLGSRETADRGVLLDSQSDVEEEEISDESPQIKRPQKNAIKRAYTAPRTQKKIRRGLTRELEPHNGPGFQEVKAAKLGRRPRAAKIHARQSIKRLDWNKP